MHVCLSAGFDEYTPIHRYSTGWTGFYSANFDRVVRPGSEGRAGGCWHDQWVITILRDSAFLVSIGTRTSKMPSW